MHPTTFKESNCTFGPPPDMTESQVMSIPAFKGETKTGSCDGALMVVVAWKPDPHDLERLNQGGSVYLVQLGGLSPHIIGTDFEEVTYPV